MKYIVILGDGMADYPVEQLGGKTPLMAANKPSIDRIARMGRTGMFKTIEDDMPTGSAVANLAVLGYDPYTAFQGRGVLEAASIGEELTDDEIAMRVNLVCVEEGKMRSHSSGHIETKESHELVRALQEHFKDWGLRLVPGFSYRHVLVLPEGDAGVECFPPHDYVGKPIEEMMVKANRTEAQPTAELLNRIILESNKVLENHPINQKRREKGQQAANYLWPWSPGKKPKMETYQEKYGVRGAVISAVDLIKGLAVYSGMTVIEVEGATGLYDTNFEGKADAALKALEDHDFVYVHVEAADEAGHEKNAELKVKCIEYLDQRLVKRILDGIEGKEEQYVIAVLPDHATPVIHGAHTRDPIPVAIWTPGVEADAVEAYDEKSCQPGSLGMLHGSQFMDIVLGKTKS